MRDWQATCLDMNSTQTVSYTHLDVYKRQVYGKYIEKNRAIEILHSGVIPQKSQEGPDGKRLREREEFFEER